MTVAPWIALALVVFDEAADADSLRGGMAGDTGCEKGGDGEATKVVTQLHVHVSLRRGARASSAVYRESPAPAASSGPYKSQVG